MHIPTPTPLALAQAIVANCNAHHMNEISRAEWSAQQDVLWAIAAEHCLASQVLRLLAPSY